MPWTKTRLKDGSVRVSSPSGVRARSTTEDRANRQIALLRAIEMGFDPDKGESIGRFWERIKTRRT